MKNNNDNDKIRKWAYRMMYKNGEYIKKLMVKDNYFL